MSQEVEVRRFKAYADDGTEYTIVEYATTRENITPYGRKKVQNPLTTLRTDNGCHVNCVAEGVYEVLVTASGPVITVRTKDGTTGNSAQ